MKLFWIICNFEKHKKVSEIDFKKIAKLSSKFEFDAKVAYISKERYCKQEELESVKNLVSDKLSFHIYPNSATENQCILNAISLCEAERYFVCDARYLDHEELISEMLNISSYYGMHFVRCQKTYDGIFVAPQKFINKWHNNLLSLTTDTKNEKYIRNFVIFNNEVKDYMLKKPTASALIRETNFLLNTNTEVVEVPPKFKKAKHYIENWIAYLIGFSSLFLSFWCLISMFLLRTNLDVFTWLLMGIICFGIVGLVTINHSLVNGKTIFHRPYNRKEEKKPIFELKELKKKRGRPRKTEKEQL